MSKNSAALCSVVLFPSANKSSQPVPSARARAVRRETERQSAKAVNNKQQQQQQNIAPFACATPLLLLAPNVLPLLQCGLLPATLCAEKSVPADRPSKQ